MAQDRVSPGRSATFVNLGYVLNVIENPEERAATLHQAWSLCRQLLVVSAQVLLSGRGKTAVEFGDGVVTERGTFQKYFEQAELRTYLEAQLGTEALPAGIGTFYLFKDEARRQRFLANRFRRREILPRRRLAEPPSMLHPILREIAVELRSAFQQEEVILKNYETGNAEHIRVPALRLVR